MTIENRGGRPARRAFSLLEMLAAVTIIAIIAAIVVPRIGLHAYAAKQKSCLQYRGDINAAIERYLFDNGVPPTQLSDLENGDYYPGTIPNCPADNTAYTIDPSTNRIAGHNH
jgi:prepilin-type N-terminal cleavage/methylation domain-containing protein